MRSLIQGELSHATSLSWRGAPACLAPPGSLTAASFLAFPSARCPFPEGAGALGVTISSLLCFSFCCVVAKAERKGM